MGITDKCFYCSEGIVEFGCNKIEYISPAYGYINLSIVNDKYDILD